MHIELNGEIAHNLFQCTVLPFTCNNTRKPSNSSDILNVVKIQTGYLLPLAQPIVKLFLCLNQLSKHYAMDVWGSGCIDTSFLGLVLVGGEWSASRPCHFTPGETASSTHWIVCWVDSRASLDDTEK
jgi:hypothetical protein